MLLKIKIINKYAKFERHYRPNYKKFNNYKPITLDGIYKGDLQTLSNLDFNINEIVNAEAPE